MKKIILFNIVFLLIACSEKTIIKINYAYFECEECMDGELDSLLKNGNAFLPEIRNFLLKGPPKQKYDSLITHLEITYLKLKEFEKEFPDNKITLTKQQYIDTFSGNYKNQYRIRSIIALKKINSIESKKILQETLFFAKENKWNEELINEILK